MFMLFTGLFALSILFNGFLLWLLCFVQYRVYCLLLLLLFAIACYCLLLLLICLSLFVIAYYCFLLLLMVFVCFCMVSVRLSLSFDGVPLLALWFLFCMLSVRRSIGFNCQSLRLCIVFWLFLMVCLCGFFGVVPAWFQHPRNGEPAPSQRTEHPGWPAPGLCRNYAGTMPALCRHYAKWMLEEACFLKQIRRPQETLPRDRGEVAYTIAAKLNQKSSPKASFSKPSLA